MAVYMNAKGSTNSSFQIGKRGNKIFGGTNKPSNGDVSTGDLWFDNSNSLVRIASVSGNAVSWANVVQADSSVSLDDVTITGNLTVQGDTTTINTQTLNVEDNIIVVNSGFSGADNVVDAGIEVNRGDETNVQLLWDESEGEWTLGSEFLSAGGFTGNLTGDVTGNVQPNGGPNSVTANTITTSGTLNVTGATITGANTDSISEGTNKYYTDERVDDRVSTLITAGVNIATTYDDANGTFEIRVPYENIDDRVGAIMAGSGAATVTYDDANATITVNVSGLGVDDFSTTNYDATGDSWSDDDSTFATTAAIADRIEAQIAADSNVVHTTGNETISGNKTINNSTFALAANSTLDVSNATITGANTDSISEGSTNLYFTNPRARSVISVVDNSTAGDEISYNSATGTITWEGTDAGSPGGSNTQIQFNDDGAFGGHANLTFNSSSETLSVSNLNVTNFTYQILSEDYGNVGESTLVTQDFGNITADANGAYIHDIVEDETPQLGGNLDLNSNNITGTGDIDITGTATFSGNVTLEGFSGNENEVVVVGSGGTLSSTDNLTIDVANSRVGIGTASPSVKLDIVGEATNETQMRMAQHNDSADAPDVRFFKSRGTEASPTAVNNGDNLGFVNSFSYDGSAYQQSGAFGWQADGTDADSKFILNTRVGGTVGTRLEVLNTGDVDIKQAVVAKSYKDTVFTITDGASVDIDPDNGGIQVWTLGANRSPTANNFDAGAKVMLMINDGSGYTITWPSVNWVGGVAPTLATSGYSIVELWKVGSQLYGAFAGGVA